MGPSPGAAPARRHGDLREDAHWQDRDARGRAVRLDRERQGQDPGQRGHPARSAAPDLCWQAARGRPHPVGLQHPEGVDAAPGAPSARRQLASRACLMPAVSVSVPHSLWRSSPNKINLVQKKKKKKKKKTPQKKKKKKKKKK